MINKPLAEFENTVKLTGRWTSRCLNIKKHVFVVLDIVTLILGHTEMSSLLLFVFKVEQKSVRVKAMTFVSNRHAQHIKHTEL